MQLRAENPKLVSALSNYQQILYQFFEFTQNLKQSHGCCRLVISSTADCKYRFIHVCLMFCCLSWLIRFVVYRSSQSINADGINRSGNFIMILNNKSSKRKKELDSLKHLSYTIVFFFPIGRSANVSLETL